MKNKVVINRLDKDNKIFDIVPLRVKRDWMTSSRDKFAYKCLPLNIANQYGWAVLCPVDLSVVWMGGVGADDVDVIIKDESFDKQSIATYFGESILTFHPDFVVQTPENYSIYVRGIPNYSKPGVIPLDAIVETDWLPFTFTYNFQLVAPGVYDFKKGEPLFAFFPVERNTVETFDLEEIWIEENPDPNFVVDFKAFERHAVDRKHDDFHHRLYLQGKSPNRIHKIKNHITKLLFGGKSDKI